MINTDMCKTIYTKKIERLTITRKPIRSFSFFLILLIRVSMKFIHANSIRAAKTIPKHIIMKTSRAVAQPTYNISNKRGRLGFQRVRYRLRYHIYSGPTSFLLTCGLLFPPNPIVTTDNTVVAPRLVLAGISVPFSVLTNQNVTQEQQTINVNGT